MPSLNAVMSDVLQLDYTKLAELRGGPLSVIGNLPYHITSQVEAIYWCFFSFSGPLPHPMYRT